MDSDSDDDFLSADEGDDEILDKTPPKVIQISSKTENISLEERLNDVSSHKEDRENEVSHDSKKETVSEDVSVPHTQKEVQKKESSESEVLEKEPPVDKEQSTDITDKEPSEIGRKPRRIKRLGDKAKEVDSKIDVQAEVVSTEENVKEKEPEEEDPKEEDPAEEGSKEVELKEDEPNAEEPKRENMKLEEPKEDCQKKEIAEENNSIQEVYEEVIENESIKEDNNEEDDLKERDIPEEVIIEIEIEKEEGIREDDLKVDIKKEENEEKVNGEESTQEDHFDKTESKKEDDLIEDDLKNDTPGGVVSETNNIANKDIIKHALTENQVEENKVPKSKAELSDENDKNDAEENCKRPVEQFAIDEEVCSVENVEILEAEKTDVLDTKSSPDKEPASHTVTEVEKEEPFESESDKASSTKEPSAEEPNEKKQTGKVATEKPAPEKVPSEKPQKPRKIKRLGVKTEKLGTKTKDNKKSNVENSEQATENNKHAEEVDDGWNDNDFTDDFSTEKKNDKKSDTTPGGDGDWGWDSWADNFISQATNKVTNLMETVEGQLGIPDPNNLAKNIKAAELERENKLKESSPKYNIGSDPPAPQEQPKDNLTSWFSSFVPVNSISNLVQITGQDLVTGGIDALEYLGKSTVSYISDGDPGLRNKRKVLFEKRKGPSLASVLQEAKLKTEENAIPVGEDPKKLNDMLEKFQALAHMDAIQMLSNEIAAKVKRILNVQSEEAKMESLDLLEGIKEAYELNEDGETNLENLEFKKDLFASTKLLRLKVTCSKLLNTWSKLNEKVDVMDYDDCEKTFESCIASLAELVARCIEYYRKVADMMLLTDFQAKEQCLVRAKSLKTVTEMFQHEVSGLSNKYANYLANNDEDKKTSDLITDIYMESENCCSLIQDSHQLLLPILHSSAIK